MQKNINDHNHPPTPHQMTEYFCTACSTLLLCCLQPLYENLKKTCMAKNVLRTETPWLWYRGRTARITLAQLDQHGDFATLCSSGGSSLRIIRGWKHTHTHIDPSRRHCRPCGGVRAVRPGVVRQSLSYNIILSGGAAGYVLVVVRKRGSAF